MQQRGKVARPKGMQIWERRQVQPRHRVIQIWEHRQVQPQLVRQLDQGPDPLVVELKG